MGGDLSNRKRKALQPNSRCLSHTLRVTLTYSLACVWPGKEGHAWVRRSHTAMITQRTLLERLVTKRGRCDGRWRTPHVWVRLQPHKHLPLQLHKRASYFLASRNQF
jgi:hypothetical protein